MMKAYTRVCARIDLDAIEQNFEKMHENIPESSKMIAVVKTDGYGHGAVPIAQMMEEKPYIWGYAVASADEGVVLRKNGIRKPILVLGCVFPDQLPTAVEHELRVTVYRKETAELLSGLSEEQNKPAYIHIKIDTGMSRLGFLPQKESVAQIKEICGMPGIVAEGMFTHFAKADETDKAFTMRQLQAYRFMQTSLKEEGVTFSYYHCANSAAIIDLPETGMDLMRAGISIYGLYPSEEVKKENVPLCPALELVSHIAHVKWIPADTPVSYGGTWRTKRDTKVATVPVGYGDGYPRSLSNKGYVLIHGQRAPILGRICMDQFMVDVTEIDQAAFGDTVTLVGRNGDETLPVEVLSDLSGRFNYEFVCDLGKRIPREYIRHGRVVEQRDSFS